jgi:hypothetical protein
MLHIKIKKELKQPLSRLSGNCLTQQVPAFLFHERDRHKIVVGCADVIDGPFRIVMRQHFADTVGAVRNRVGTIFPIKQLDPVEQALPDAVDRYLDFDLLLTLKRWDRDCNVAHGII